MGLNCSSGVLCLKTSEKPSWLFDFILGPIYLLNLIPILKLINTFMGELNEN